MLLFSACRNAIETGEAIGVLLVFHSPRRYSNDEAAVEDVLVNLIRCTIQKMST